MRDSVLLILATGGTFSVIGSQEGPTSMTPDSSSSWQKQKVKFTFTIDIKKMCPLITITIYRHTPVKTDIWHLIIKNNTYYEQQFLQQIHVIKTCMAGQLFKGINELYHKIKGYQFIQITTVQLVMRRKKKLKWQRTQLMLWNRKHVSMALKWIHL